MDWKELSKMIEMGGAISRAEALAVLCSEDDSLLEVINGAARLRFRYFGRNVSVHILKNAKSGHCGEDCAFCSQSSLSSADIRKYPLVDADEIISEALAASELGAVRYCIVTSGGSPGPLEIETICKAGSAIKKQSDIQLCTSLGILTKEQARRLKESGIDRYNHNLETSKSFYSSICRTHTYDDRVNTVITAKEEGLEICSGCLIGMGESLEDRVDAAFALRELGADSIPVNFLDPRPGTPFEKLPRLSPSDCLRTLAMFRYVLPDREIRAAGGREACLRSMQPLALFVANSIFAAGYLTTGGQGYEADESMIKEAGFFINELQA